MLRKFGLFLVVSVITVGLVNIIKPGHERPGKSSNITKPGHLKLTPNGHSNKI